MAETVDNKKIVLTNRTALAVLIFVIGTTFSATTFYNESKYQDLVAQQNQERIEALKLQLEDFKKAEADAIGRIKDDLQALEEELRAFTVQIVEQEVAQGLRPDWERKNQDFTDRFEKLEAKADKLIDRLIN